MSELCFEPAVRLRERLLAREISAIELLGAFEAQVSRHNPAINALVTLDFAGAITAARRADKALADGSGALGPLHGLPLAVKDVFRTAGLRTTFGNHHFADHVPERDAILVERERAAGAVIFAKSNTPDCASGGITYNEIFGLTRNPWHPGRTCSGSSGGAGAAMAAGLAALADGSDVGGSVRTPAGWANCVGLRPSAGWVPGRPGEGADGDISTAGIISRTTADACLFMQACAAPHPDSATRFPAGAETFSLDALHRNERPAIGWVSDFANAHIDPESRQRLAAARQVFSELGFKVQTVDLDLGEAFRDLYADINAIACVRYLPPRVCRAISTARPQSPRSRTPSSAT